MKKVSFLIPLLLVLTGLCTEGTAAPEKQMAIVIDEWGNGAEGTDRIIHSPFPLTVAVRPFLHTTHSDALTMHAKGHDVIVHLPMEGKRGRKKWLGPGAITTDLSDQEIRQRVLAAIEDVPYAVGVNNRMGSKISTDERILRVMMQVLNEKGLFYLDNKNAPDSIACAVAADMDVPCIESDMFLDNVHAAPHIQMKLNDLENRLMDDGKAVAIGHVGTGDRITPVVLAQAQLKFQENTRFVTLSKMIDEFAN